MWPCAPPPPPPAAPPQKEFACEISLKDTPAAFASQRFLECLPPAAPYHGARRGAGDQPRGGGAAGAVTARQRESYTPHKI